MQNNNFNNRLQLPERINNHGLAYKIINISNIDVFAAKIQT